MTDRLTRSLLVATTALTLCHAAPGFAQDAPAPASTGTATPAQDAEPAQPTEGDIIVTARRVEERLQDVPISITVFDQKQIANRNVINSQDLANYTPSLSANSNFGNENTSFAIRGFVQDIGTPPSVGVYFADVVALRGPTQGTTAGDGAGPGSFFDLQNVQVLKGPQGTLQGRNTTGGAVLFVPQKPTSRLEGFVEGSYGNYDMKRVQGAINIPLSDIARFRIAADHLDRDGYLNNISGIGPSHYNDIGYTAVRASLVVDLTPELENYTIASFSHSDTNGSVQKLIGCAPTIGLGNSFACPQIAAETAKGAGFYDVSSNMTNPRSLLNQWQVINTTTWRSSDALTIKNIASYGQLRNYQRSPLFGTNWSAGGQQIAFAYIVPANGLNTANQSTFTEELQFQGSAMEDRLVYQGGAYLEVSNPLGAVGNQSPFLIACTNSSALQCTDIVGIGASQQFGFAFPIHVGAVNYTVGRTTYRDVGLYGQATYTLTDQLKLTGGVRYTWDRQTNDSTRISYLFPVLPPFTGGATGTCTDATSAPTCREALTQKSNKPTWLIDLDYKPVDDVLLYAKYSRGYRAGGIFANAPQEYRTFKPEKVDSYEAGIKTTLRGPVRGNFNVSGFYNNFSDQQLLVGFNPSPTANVSNTTGIVNAGKSRIYGAEVEANISPFRGFNIQGSYTYLNTKIKRIAPILLNDPNYLVDVQIQEGSALALSPKNKFSVTPSYTLPLDSSIGKISLAATWTHTDKQLSTYLYSNPAIVTAFGADYGTLASRDILNLNIGWESVAGKPIDLALFATNVTKEKYYAFVAGLGSSGFEAASLGEPRMYGARLRYRFGG